jgi:hypothetical protein
MPLPPPPAEALSITGKPIFFAAATASSVVSQRAPGTMGTPAEAILSRAAVFEPSWRMALAGGPTNVTPARSQASAKSGFSLKNP